MGIPVKGCKEKSEIGTTLDYAYRVPLSRKRSNDLLRPRPMQIIRSLSRLSVHPLGEKGSSGEKEAKGSKDAGRQKAAEGGKNSREHKTDNRAGHSKAERAHLRNASRSKDSEQREEDETRRPMPKQTLIAQGLHPHPGPDPKERISESPTPEQRHRWKRKSIWESSDDEGGNNDVATSRARIQAGEPNPTKTETSNDQRGMAVEITNPYLEVRGDAKWQEAFQEVDGDEVQQDSTEKQCKPTKKGRKPQREKRSRAER